METSPLGDSKKRYGAGALSTPNFDNLLPGLGNSKNAKFNRSSSVGPGMAPSNLNNRERNRRALYVNLPFISVYGMQHREHSIARSLSRMGLSEMGEIAEEKEMMTAEADLEDVVITTHMVYALFVAVILEFLVGYNLGVMNAPAAVIFPEDHSLYSVAVSVFAIGGPFGAVLAGQYANRAGRRAAIVQNAWIFLVGGLLLTLAPSMLWLIPARLIIGFASGYATVIVPIYLGELAPPTLRGTLGTLTQFSMVIGILAADLMAFPFATEACWRVMFGLTPVLCMIQLLLSSLLFETPRYLLNKDAYSMEARVAIRKLRGFRSEEEVDVEMAHIAEAMKFQALENRTSAHSASAVFDLLKDRKVRLLVVSFTVLHVAQQLSGINAVFYYSTMFFDGIIDNPLVGTTLVGLVNVLATYVALQLMDKTGRVTLLLWSEGGMLVCTAVLTAALLGYFSNMVAVVAVMGYVAFFEIGLGPITWLIVAEMFDAKYVATAMSIASQINWFFNFVVGITFPILDRELGPWSFVPFGIVLVISFVFTLKYLPETAGRTVAEVQRVANGGDVDEDEMRQATQYLVVEGVDLSAM